MRTPTASVRWAATGPLAQLDRATLERLLDRGAPDGTDIEDAVAGIINRVRADGDAALVAMAQEYDRCTLSNVEVPRSALIAALESIDPAVRMALEQAAAAIAGFHRAQLPGRVEHEPYPGVRLTRIAEPIERVGVYAPGGRAAYPSSVLMGAVPARVAGVREVVVCSPPGPDGSPSTIVLAACSIAGVDRVFAIGGAGAIAALVFGTVTVPRVARVVGPGNAWVTEAKRQLQGRIAIDCPAGPSELLLIADDTADPVLLAAELVAQAEHDPDAAVVLIAADHALAAAVDREVATIVNGHPREEIVRDALRTRGALLEAPIDEACRFACDYAPEHLLIATARPRELLPAIRNAGTIFLGASSSVAFGDYVTGANHVLPTGRAARAFSGLDVLDFVRWTTVQEVSQAAAASLAAPTAILADAERLPGHAFAARLRADGGANDSGAKDDVAKDGVAKDVVTQDGVAKDRVAKHGVANDERTAGVASWAGRPTTRPAYASISTYDPGRRPVAIDLSDNTNLFGVCPAVEAVLTDRRPSDVTRYPSVYADALVEAAAARFGVEPDCVTTGCGSDDVIDSAFRAFCEPGDIVAYPWPTFGIVPAFARMNATRPAPVEQAPGSPLDAASLIATGARMIYLCRPNNPTGASAPREEVLSLAEAFDGVLLVDEAYADFGSDDLLAEAASSRNIIVMRTLSKAFGLAGMRTGLAIGPPRLIAEVTKSRGPYKVNGLAERAGVAALRDGADWVEWCVDETLRNRERLHAALSVMGHAPLPSSANFILLPLPPAGGSAREVAAALHRRGVGVRPFEALPGLGECIRITVGPWDMMQTFLDALADVLPPSAPGA